MAALITKYRSVLDQTRRSVLHQRDGGEPVPYLRIMLSRIRQVVVENVTELHLTLPSCKTIRNTHLGMMSDAILPAVEEYLDDCVELALANRHRRPIRKGVTTRPGITLTTDNTDDVFRRLTTDMGRLEDAAGSVEYVDRE